MRGKAQRKVTAALRRIGLVAAISHANGSGAGRAWGGGRGVGGGDGWREGESPSGANEKCEGEREQGGEVQTCRNM